MQHPRRFSKCSITDYKNFLLKGGASCLFNRPNKVIPNTPLFPRHTADHTTQTIPSCPYCKSKIMLCPLAALWGYRMWQRVCRGGRGVWLWKQDGELIYTAITTHYCNNSAYESALVSLLSKHGPPIQYLMTWKMYKRCKNAQWLYVRMLFLVQECYKDCCKKCSLSNGAHCSDGPCCNSTCLVRAQHFLVLVLLMARGL